ncbi:MAG: hypothetical protein EZS28_052960 [Streblomastix strix]|uniref:Uncharacterized protein n=1 Tax=Streblomastix strix TaxID=222440 RepID=A0A5J4RN81_9EUKA|nr:MAG: hypothetical protein EZS28_052960 [Streblomastix strix]
MIYSSSIRIKHMIKEKSFAPQAGGVNQAPLDILFVWLSKYFPFDSLFFLVLFFYIFIAVMISFLSFGIGCPCCRPLFRIKWQGTSQQGVLLMSGLVIIMFLDLSIF